MSDNNGPGIITIALGVCFGLILASEEGVFHHAANNVQVNTGEKSALSQVAPAPLKVPTVPALSGQK